MVCKIINLRIHPMHFSVRHFVCGLFIDQRLINTCIRLMHSSVRLFVNGLFVDQCLINMCIRLMHISVHLFACGLHMDHCLSMKHLSAFPAVNHFRKKPVNICYISAPARRQAMKCNLTPFYNKYIIHPSLAFMV